MTKLKLNKYLFFFLVVVAAFWQIAFLQNGMKWDFADAFLPSRYFFSESILNNQFPLWNPYLLYGSPIYADLVSVFNPEFWIVGNMFGYNNIVLQLMYLVYIYVAGVSFSYFLKQYKTEENLSLGLSVAYMLSGFSIGNAQHLAFISGYALIPLVMASYIKFLRDINRKNFVFLAIALYLMIFCSYPAITVILGYLLLLFFIYQLILNRANKNYLKKLVINHLELLGIILAFSAVLLIAFFQTLPFLDRYSGLSVDLANKHAFTLKAFISFLIPMATGKNPQFFETDISMTNGYFGIISIILLMVAVTKKSKEKESYLFLFFGVFAVIVALGDQFFLREFLYRYFPFMNMFQYPSLFRAFAIFGFLAFMGINLHLFETLLKNKRIVYAISGLAVFLLVYLILTSVVQSEDFIFFRNDIGFAEKLDLASRFDNIVFQGLIQIVIISTFFVLTRKIKNKQKYSLALLLLFVTDGIVSTQLNVRYTVINDDDPIEFARYLKASPKGFPVPDLNPVRENSDKNAQNEFVWMNNNVYPKRVTFDGKVAFKLNGYSFLADNHPDLLESVKKNPLAYFSDDVGKNSLIKQFKPTTAFLDAGDYKHFEGRELKSAKSDELSVTGFSPKHIQLETSTAFLQLLVFQQNFFPGWKVFIDGEEQDLLVSNFTHMAVKLPPGHHTVLFKYENPLIIVLYYLSAFIFCVLIALYIRFYFLQNPGRKTQIIIFLGICIVIFASASGINRYLYNKNKIGLAPQIIKSVENWKAEYKNKVSVFLSTPREAMREAVDADATAFINENTNVSELSYFLMNSKDEYFAFAWQGGIIHEYVFKLIRSFYPVAVQEIRNENSGVILVKKGSSNKYYYTENFETNQQSGWSKDKSRINRNIETGNHFYDYTPNEKSGTMLDINIDKELTRIKEISVFADVKIMEPSSEALLVFNLQRDNKDLVYEVLILNQFVDKTEEWYRIVFTNELPAELHKNDLIRVYFWNRNRAHFHIDNLKLKINK